MRKSLTVALAVVLLSISLTAQAEETCPDPERPIHYSVLCLSEAEFVALTAPPPPPVPQRAVSVAGVEQWRSMVAYFWPSQHVDRMLRIMRCESGGDPEAWNRRTDDRGLFQINQRTWARAWPGNHFDPWTNASVAYQIWLVQGFDAWVCRG